VSAAVDGTIFVFGKITSHENERESERGVRERYTDKRKI